MNGLRGHLAEYGYVAPKGVCYVERLVEQIEDPSADLPEAARASLTVMVQVLRALGEHTFNRYVEIKRQEWEDYRVQVTQWELDRYLAIL